MQVRAGRFYGPTGKSGIAHKAVGFVIVGCACNQVTNPPPARAVIAGHCAVGVVAFAGTNWNPLVQEPATCPDVDTREPLSDEGELPPHTSQCAPLMAAYPVYHCARCRRDHDAWCIRCAIKQRTSR